MTPEEAYAETLCRIREAAETGAIKLDLSGRKEWTAGGWYHTGLETLNRLPPELVNLTSLQSLSLSGCLLSDLTLLAGLKSLQALDISDCEQLNDLSPLASLTSLQSLDLTECRLNGDLSPLAGLTSLQSLNLAGCRQLTGDLSPLAGLASLQRLNITGCRFRRFAALESLLATLEELRLFGCKFEDLPSEVCAEWDENVLDKVRAHYKDLKFGQRIDAEVKVLFLGNGGVGKTQLCRRLRDLPFDPNIPTTHGIQLGEMTLRLDDFPEPVRLNLWDFGGQSSGRLNLNRRPATRKASLHCVTARFPIGLITSAPLPGQMLPCSSCKASAIRAINACRIRQPKWTILARRG